MNQKAKEALDKLIQYLQNKRDFEGVALVNQMLRAILDGENDVLRKG